MGDLLRVILECLHYLWPLRVIRSYQQGVFMRGGGEPRLLAPRRLPYFFCPGWDSIEILDVLPDVMDLPVQNVTTADDKMVSLSFNVTFQITDATAHWRSVQDFHENMPRMATRHVMAKVRTWTWDELRTKQAELERSLRETMNTRMNKLDWGAEITDVGLTDLICVRTFRLVGGI